MTKRVYKLGFEGSREGDHPRKDWRAGVKRCSEFGA